MGGDPGAVIEAGSVSLQLGEAGTAALIAGIFGVITLVIGWVLRRVNNRRPADPDGIRNEKIETVRELSDAVRDCHRQHVECERRNADLERRVARLEIAQVTGPQEQGAATV
jgi:hypothetical protein